MSRDRISVTIVTWNSEAYIARCLESVFSQTQPVREVVVADNASTDGTAAILRGYGARIRVLWNSRNEGFAKAQNQAIGATRGDWVLTLNPDVKLDPGFLEALVAAGRMDARIGTVCGKLRSVHADFSLPAEPLLDSTGIYFTPALRHLDRGWHEPDDGRYNQPEYVFGACAAAALFRRAAIRDISDESGFFDPDFFAYREDADVAWRSQLLGWRCFYTPEATGYHVRRVTPENRRQLPWTVNMHSVKNRFLMRVKNVTGGVYGKYALSITGRDLMVLGGCLLREPASLIAFWKLAQALPDAIRKRKRIMARRVADDAGITAWFAGSVAGRLTPGYNPPARGQAPLSVGSAEGSALL